MPEGIGYWGRLQLGLNINTFGAKEKKKGRICLKTKLGQHIECSAIDSVSLKDEPYCHFLSHLFFNKRRRRIPRKKAGWNINPILSFFLTKQEELARLSDLLLSQFFIFQVRTGPKLSTPEKKKEAKIK